MDLDYLRALQEQGAGNLYTYLKFPPGGCDGQPGLGLMLLTSLILDD